MQHARRVNTVFKPGLLQWSNSLAYIFNITADYLCNDTIDLLVGMPGTSCSIGQADSNMALNPSGVCNNAWDGNALH